MKSLVPGRFTTAVVRTGDGELEAQLSEGGHWQVKVRSAGEAEWCLLCVGHLDGRVLAPSPTEAQAAVKIGPLSIDFERRRVEVDGVDQELRAREFDLLAMLASEPRPAVHEGRAAAQGLGTPGGRQHPNHRLARQQNPLQASRSRCRGLHRQLPGLGLQALRGGRD